jgi:hypothetical protein
MANKRKTPPFTITLPQRLRDKAARIGANEKGKPNASRGIAMALEAWKEMKGEGR